MKTILSGMAILRQLFCPAFHTMRMAASSIGTA
jgi:hypothetical protein